jgi:L-ascorbate metabolism protein UlaG (beta-lactamase superfamily)
MNTLLRSLLFSLILVPQINTLLAHSQPIMKDGKYYYSENDTYEHINLAKALAFLSKKILSPGQWAKAITSLFYKTEEPRVSAVELLNPTQCVPEKSSIEPKIVWIGHATFLVQINGFNILTDPVFGDVKVGPFSLSKRALPVGVTFENLPPIHAIVISHNHSDHTDTDTLTAIAERDNPVVFVPQGDLELFKDMGFSDVVENNWWQKHALTIEGRSVQFTFLPAYHWSIRFSLSSYRKSLWGSWMISANDTNIYFAGDTAYGDHFKEIAQEFPTINLALLPIGPTNEGDENRHKLYHVNAQEALQAFIDLNARTFVPMHYGTFFSGKESLENPIAKLYETWEKRQAQLQDKKLLFARCGEQYLVL